MHGCMDGWLAHTVLHDDVMVRKTSLTDKYKCSNGCFHPSPSLSILLTHRHRLILRTSKIWRRAFPFISIVGRRRIRLRLGRMFSITNIRQSRRRRRDAAISSDVRVCESAPIHLLAERSAWETNKASNIHINVKYGRFNDTFCTNVAPYMRCAHRDRIESLALSQHRHTEPHTTSETRLTDTTIDELMCAETKQDTKHTNTETRVLAHSHSIRQEDLCIFTFSYKWLRIYRLWWRTHNSIDSGDQQQLAGSTNGKTTASTKNFLVFPSMCGVRCVGVGVCVCAPSAWIECEWDATWHRLRGRQAMCNVYTSMARRGDGRWYGDTI